MNWFLPIEAAIRRDGAGGTHRASFSKFEAFSTRDNGISADAPRPACLHPAAPVLTLSRRPIQIKENFRHIFGRHGMYLLLKTIFVGTNMRFLIAMIVGAAFFLFPQPGSAESADVEAVIDSVDESDLTLKLADGKTYVAPEEFNFDGLKKGVKVVVFYTETDGKRVINDLQIVE
jgi:hypothetical protein